MVHTVSFVSPDRQFYYVSISHGRPFGSVWKYSTKDDSVVGKATLGFFPATLDVSPDDGNFLFVVNFNLHGDMVPSTVSVVSTQTDDRSRAHTNVHDASWFASQSAGVHKTIFGVHDGRHARRDRHAFTQGQRVISSSLQTTKRGLNGPPQPRATQSTHSMHGHAGHGSEPPKPGDKSCSPTWAEPSI